jgi:shikimate dehydrogenase
MADTSGGIVDGATRIFAIIGEPIAQVKSPAAITQRFRAAGRNAILIPLNIPTTAFDAVMRGLKALANFDGYVVTIPHKERAMAHVDRLLATAQAVGAVNVVRRERDGSWSGDMYDGQGLVEAAVAKGVPMRGRRVLLLGAGGAGKAIAFALAKAGAAAVTAFDLDRARAEDLAARLATAYPACAVRASEPALIGHDTVVNATPVGMAPGAQMPVAFDAFPSDMVVADMITDPDITPLLASARACGCRIVTGPEAYEAQADALARFLMQA